MDILIKNIYIHILKEGDRYKTVDIKDNKVYIDRYSTVYGVEQLLTRHVLKPKGR